MHFNRMRAIAWSALVIVFIAASLANFANFAARPSLPPDWLDVSANEAAALKKNLDSETPAARRQDGQRYVWLLLEAGKRQEGHDAAAALQPITPDPSRYDVDYTHRLQQLAVAELMHDRVEDMLLTLQHLYEYDQKYLPGSDVRLVRDCNNLGLVCYMVGQNSEDEEHRYELFAQAGQWLRQAESGFQAGCLVDRLSVKENALMLAESSKDEGACERLRRQVDALTFQLGGPAPQVTL